MCTLREAMWWGCCVHTQVVLLIAIRWDWVEGGEARQGIELALWHQFMV